MSILKIQNLNVVFNNIHALKDINLSVEYGEIIALLGPSGSGKSTLLRCINALEIAQSGIIKVDNCFIDFSKLQKNKIKEIRKLVGMVFQNHNLFANKTALENIMEGLLIVQNKSKQEAKNLALQYLKKVGLEDKQNSYPNALSGGQAQRIGIARALALKPKIMLFDEPTSALDIELIGEVLAVIKDIAKSHNQTMIIITHELEFAKQISSKVAFMSEGQILEFLPTNEFFSVKENRNIRVKNFLRNFKGFNEDFCI